MSLTNILKNGAGDYEVNRTVGAVGAISYIVMAPALTWAYFARTGLFDLVAFCTAYPAGLGVTLGSIAGAVALKDRNVAVAKVTADTGSAPGLAAASGVQSVQVVNAPSQPIPVEQTP